MIDAAGGEHAVEAGARAAGRARARRWPARLSSRTSAAHGDGAGQRPRGARSVRDVPADRTPSRRSDVPRAVGVVVAGGWRRRRTSNSSRSWPIVASSTSSRSSDAGSVWATWWSWKSSALASDEPPEPVEGEARGARRPRRRCGGRSRRRGPRGAPRTAHSADVAAGRRRSRSSADGPRDADGQRRSAGRRATPKPKPPAKPATRGGSEQGEDEGRVPVARWRRPRRRRRRPRPSDAAASAAVRRRTGAAGPCGRAVAGAGAPRTAASMRPSPSPMSGLASASETPSGAPPDGEDRLAERGEACPTVRCGPGRRRRRGSRPERAADVARPPGPAAPRRSPGR